MKVILKEVYKLFLILLKFEIKIVYSFKCIGYLELIIMKFVLKKVRIIELFDVYSSILVDIYVYWLFYISFRI